MSTDRLVREQRASCVPPPSLIGTRCRGLPVSRSRRAWCTVHWRYFPRGWLSPVHLHGARCRSNKAKVVARRPGSPLFAPPPRRSSASVPPRAAPCGPRFARPGGRLKWWRPCGGHPHSHLGRRVLALPPSGRWPCTITTRCTTPRHLSLVSALRRAWPGLAASRALRSPPVTRRSGSS